jgi:xylulokinase
VNIATSRSGGGHAVGIDLGSQSMKADLLAPDGRIVASAQSSYDMDCPRPGWAQQDPADWWRALGAVIARLIEARGLGRADIGALAFASQVDGAVLVDAARTVLHPALVWLDRRAEEEAAWLEGRLSAAVFRDRSGLNIDSTHVAPKLIWLRRHAPEAFDRAAAFHLPGSWVVDRLTGRSVVDHSNASSTLVYDVQLRQWSAQLLEAADLDVGMLPEVADSTAIAGRLTVAAAKELGLAPHCLVAVGCGDEHAAAMGAGVLTAGPVCDIAGTAEAVAVAAAAPVVDPAGLVETHAHADPRSWFIENPGFVSGGSVRWFNDTIARTTFEQLTEMAAGVAPGADGVVFVPALSGAMTPRWNGRARGIFHGLSMATAMPHLARAVFEGCAFGVRDIVDRFSQLGLGEGDIRVVGGGSRSDVLLQMKADVTGRVVERAANAEATTVGAAMIAGVVAGTFADLDQAATILAELEPGRFEPDPSLRPAYDDAYGAYRALYDAVEPLFDRAP